MSHMSLAIGCSIMVNLVSYATYELDPQNGDLVAVSDLMYLEDHTS